MTMPTNSNRSALDGEGPGDSPHHGGVGGERSEGAAKADGGSNRNGKNFS